MSSVVYVVYQRLLFLLLKNRYMESKMNSFHLVDDHVKYKQDEEEQEEQSGVHEHVDHVEENSDILKRRISNHPLYEFLVEAHLDCLKVYNLSLSLSLFLFLSSMLLLTIQSETLILFLQFIEFIINSLSLIQ